LPLDIVKIIYEANKEEREKHRREEGVYWVVDLVRCPLKRVYELEYPELIAREVFTPVFILGNLAHWGLQKFLSDRLGDRVSVEVEGSRVVKLPNGREVTVRGRADVVVKGGEEDVGVEIKTTRSDTGLPQPHHVDQVRIYNWLFNLGYSILIYITPDRVTQYEIYTRVDEGEVVSRILESRYPRYEWECSYCPYSVLCPHKRGRASK